MMNKRNKGITIIALVITIVIMIILSGITINLTVGEKGIITRAKEAAQKTENAQIEEQKMFNELYDNTDGNYNSVKISDLKIGWTLGNTLDANIGQALEKPLDYETGWGNPVTTNEMIAKVKQSGYNTILIPVTWYNHLESDDRINEDWINRVEQVVDYGLNNNMYVILNTHHDDKNIKLEGDIGKTVEKYKKVWQQIAERFKEKSYKLLFEVLNEPRVITNGSGNWKPETDEPYDNLNLLNEELLKSIRQTEGKNSSRWVLIPTYGTLITNTAFEKIKIPMDEHVAISVHGYTPYEYCESTSASYTAAEREAIRYQLEILNNFSKNKNVPVIITEMGCKQKASRISWIKEIYFEAGRYKIPIFYWDNGKLNDYGIFDRNSICFPEEQLVNTAKMYYEYGYKIEDSKNAIQELNTTKNVSHTNLNGIGIKQENKSNHYYMNLTPAYFSSFDYTDTYNVSDCGIYEFSCKIKTDMKQLLLRLVLNFYDENDNLIFSTNYTPIGYEIDGSKDVYETKTVWKVDKAKKVKLERIALANEEYFNKPVNFEFYDLKLTDMLQH